jgi:biopolymer transport protein TolQ
MLMNGLLLASAGAETYGVDLVEVLFSASAMVQAVLWLLVIMSIACWFIIGYKWYFFRRARHANLRFVEAFWHAKQLDAAREQAELEPFAPTARVFREAYTELSRLKKQENSDGKGLLSGFENIERTVRRATQDEVNRLEKMVPFLATTGSTAPFIGLFGTVWGIVEAFDAIPRQSGGVILDKVAGPMAHALIATAVGLLAAIPAVMAYNFFVRKIKLSVAEVDSFGSEFLNVVRRLVFKA